MVVIIKTWCRADRYLSTELQNSCPEFGPSGVRYKEIRAEKEVWSSVKWIQWNGGIQKEEGEEESCDEITISEDNLLKKNHFCKKITIELSKWLLTLRAF